MGARTLVTAEDLIQMPDSERCELVRGEIVRMPPTGWSHGPVSSKFDRRIGLFVEQHRLGVVSTAEVGYLLTRNPDTVRAPDVSFVSRERIPPGGVTEGYVPFAPDLAVEIVSPSNSAVDISDKVEEYLAAGTRMVLVVFPRRRSVTAYLPGGEARVLHEDDILDGGDVLPGFAVRVGDFFEPDY